MKIDQNTQDTLKTNFSDIQKAIEYREYTKVEPLLLAQRELVLKLTLSDPEELTYFFQAQSLTSWALMMVRKQREDIQNQLAEVGSAKQISGYREPVTAR